MPGVGCRRDAAAMISATEEFWDFERSSYDDELDAWRERTASPATFAPATLAPATFAPAAVSSPDDHPRIVGRDSRVRTWSFDRRQPARRSRPARSVARPARVRIQRSVHDRMTGSRG
jgi:hypothetical protein